MSQRSRDTSKSPWTLLAVALPIVAAGLVGCGGNTLTAPPPPPPPPPPPAQIATFNEPGSTFATSDVRDVQDQIVRFDMANGALIWAADGRSFKGYPVSGLFIGSDKSFEVRFGTKDNERRAYFTETVRETICDIEVTNGQLTISPTDVKVPGGSE